ncbi:MAG: DinB family protein [Candidatus Krumholzibacteria bacterium]|nr:DinB family protein [Candidatus Krumholzibacteria bacterium]MDH4336120.1 DinB family protein [Candidatus Krumholzibacteria bacterium]MDH5627240.1 DinB family protein [Candidatus Krumholzibacteria bacterium]
MQLMLNCLWMTRAEELLRGAEELAPADMTNARTRAAGHNQRAMAAIVAEFTVARENLLARLDAATDDDVTRAAVHPRLKRPMRLVDLCFFVAEHDDHHLAVVTRALRAQGH